MADMGAVNTNLNGVPDEGLKRILLRIFEYILKDIRFGRAIDGDASKNFGGGFFAATTPAIANEEFTIAHTFGRTPYLCMPVIPLHSVGAKLVRLTNVRAADSARIYLASPDVDADFTLYIEG